MRTRKRGIILPALSVIFISLFMICSPCEAQFSSTALNTAVEYGDFFNPLAFFPGLTRTAADYYPVFDPFAALIYPPFSPLLSPIYYPVIPPLSLFTSPSIPSAAVPVPTAATTVTRTAAQTGTWVGTWTSTSLAYIVLWHTGPMTLNIVVDPLFGSVLGTAILQGSRYTSAPFDVSGVKINNIISLEGIPSLGLGIVLTCVLTSPTTMTGFYTVTATGDIVDEGTFNLTLLAPVII
ncbi:MAG: hypothetical protein AB1847_19110 [bacterium]